jgi:hypothetical protein
MAGDELVFLLKETKLKLSVQEKNSEQAFTDT